MTKGATSSLADAWRELSMAKRICFVRGSCPYLSYTEITTNQTAHIVLAVYPSSYP